MTKMFLLIIAIFSGALSFAAKPKTNMECEHGERAYHCIGGNKMISEILLCSTDDEDYTWHFKGPMLDDQNQTGDKQSPEGKVTEVIRATGATNYRLMLEDDYGFDLHIGGRPIMDTKRKVTYRTGTLDLPLGKKTIPVKFKCFY